MDNSSTVNLTHTVVMVVYGCGGNRRNLGIGLIQFRGNGEDSEKDGSALM
ncbi:hypothetical protein HanIR_Chr15g0741141 [Helianthus annuus]|nr:hypothetical protein HanIR_Chr15g0741141 [Helianthus annuus]